MNLLIKRKMLLAEVLHLIIQQLSVRFVAELVKKSPVNFRAKYFCQGIVPEVALVVEAGNRMQDSELLCKVEVVQEAVSTTL